MTTPAYDAWLRACAEFLRDNHPEVAIYDVDPAALQAAFSVGGPPKTFFSGEPPALAETRDQSLLPFFREDVRRALATLRPGIEIRSLAPGAIEAAYVSGDSPSDFVERNVPPVAIERNPQPPAPTRSNQRNASIWLAAITGVCVALAALAIMYRESNRSPNPTETPSNVAQNDSSDGRGNPNAPAVEVTREPSPDTGSDQDAGLQSAAGDKKTANNQPEVNPLDAGQKPTSVGNVVAAPQPSPEPTGPRPSIDQFFATYAATGDDSNPWRMTLHWKASNVDRIELSYGDTTLSGTNSPQGEINIDHDPSTNGPLRPGTVYTLRGFNGNQVSTRAVTADPPP